MTFLILFLLLFMTVYTDDIDTSIILPNKECLPRKTLVVVDEIQNMYFPFIIELYKCGGACGSNRLDVTTRTCAKATSENINLHVFNELSLKNESIVFENHTSCNCLCKENGSSCSITQKWNPDKCRCECNEDFIKNSNCPSNHRFNPSTCLCQCELACLERRRKLNETSCSCYCPDKFYVKCSKKEKLLRESDCKCVTPSALVNDDPSSCSFLPTKWAVVVITISFFAVFILAFDCILYSRKTGCLFLSLNLFKKNNAEERIPIRGNQSSQDTVESNA